MLYLYGVYVEQNINYSYELFKQILNIMLGISKHIDNIWKRNYYFSDFVNSFWYALTLELQLIEDFVPHYDGSLMFGILKQSKTFYSRHAELQNHVAICCHAHSMNSVNDAIYWLEIELAFSELAYLYFVFKYDVAKTCYYSEIGDKLGYMESQMIYSMLTFTMTMTGWKLLLKI